MMYSGVGWQFKFLYGGEINHKVKCTYEFESYNVFLERSRTYDLQTCKINSIYGFKEKSERFIYKSFPEMHALSEHFMNE